jgi:serine/threonine protein kinase
VPPERTQIATPGTGMGARPAHVTSSPIQIPSGTVLIGTYEIVAHINTGGMGEVYRGVNIHNGEAVAIKIVLPALAHDEKILSLFQKESTVLRRISHDAIVRYEVFTIDPEIARPCLVMEYVEGVPLGDRMESDPLSEAEVMTLLRRLADGLEVAHRAGVVHRDLSPDNVILREGRVENAKIIDFGIAKETTPGGRTLIGGQFAGKPGYVAPEQLGLYNGHVTGQADIYSLALLAAAAALGRPIDMGDNPAEAVRARMSVPDLSGLPERLAELLGWMLQPDPADRPADMAAVLAALTPTSLPPGSWPPGTNPPGSWPPGTTPPGAVSDTGTGSPFGPPPVSTPPAGEAATGTGRGGWLVAGLAVAALALGGAWYAGVLPGLAPPGTSSPEEERAWLADWAARDTTPCRHLQPDGTPGATTGALAGFAAGAAGATGATGATAFEALGAGFAEAHGRAPDLRMIPVTDAQCDALDFLARAVQPFAPGPALALDLPDAAGGDAQGRITGRGTDTVALLLIDPAGRVQNLSSALDPESGAITLPGRRLRAPQAAEGEVFLVMALGSSAPLGTVALIPDNAILPAAQGAEFWRFLETDVARAPGRVRAHLAALPARP